MKIPDDDTKKPLVGTARTAESRVNHGEVHRLRRVLHYQLSLEREASLDYCKDCTEYIRGEAEIVSSIGGDAFNLGAGREIKILDLAKWINELTENSGGIVFRERRIWDKKNRLLSSIDKARRVLGYQPKTDFKEGLGQTYNWFTENWGNIKKSAEF